MDKIWSDRAWEDYLYWQEHDGKILRRINGLIKDTERNPFHGLGKPEPLKHERQGYWSRRIDDTHRLVYRIEGDKLLIAQCRAHYGD
jgi:toxin YoeB